MSVDHRSGTLLLTNKAIGALARWCSELDINRSRLTVLSWMPPAGQRHDSCVSLAQHNPFLLWARTSYQLLHIIDWMGQAQLAVLVKDDGMQKLRAVGIRDVFAMEVALDGASKPQIANILGITAEMADAMLTFLRQSPAFKRLKDVYAALST